MVTTSTPLARRSRSVSTTSSFVSPRPTMIPRLGEDGVVGQLLGPPQEPERLVVRRLGAAHAPVEPAHGLDVVVEDLGARGQDGAQGLLLDAEEVGRQHLDGRLGQLALDRTDRRRVVAGAAVGNVVSVDGRDHDVAQLHLGGRLSEPQRLERVRRMLRPSGVDVAVPAGAGAGVAEDLERRCAATPALADVGAACLLADRVQALSVDELLDVEVARVRARCADLHPLGTARPLGDGQRLHPASVCVSLRCASWPIRGPVPPRA